MGKMKPEYAGATPHDTQNIAFNQESSENTAQSDKPALLTPHAFWFVRANPGSWQERLSYYNLQTKRETGIVVGFASPLAEVISGIPSYSQLSGVLPPREASALATADERFAAAIAPLITSSNFEAD